MYVFWETRERDLPPGQKCEERLAFEATQNKAQSEKERAEKERDEKRRRFKEKRLVNRDKILLACMLPQYHQYN